MQSVPWGSPAPECRFQRLVADGLTVRIGSRALLNDMSFSLDAGAAVLLRGSNGSGKTTLLNVLTGFVRPSAGRVVLQRGDGEHDLKGLRQHQLVRFGVARSWQDVRLFPAMTVMENVVAASPHLAWMNPLAALLAFRRVRSLEGDARDRASENLRLLGLAECADRTASELSMGQMKRVAIARLLQSEADLLLLDEPLSGLDAENVAALRDTLAWLHESCRKTLLIVEHRHRMLIPITTQQWCLRDGVMHQE